MILSLLSAAFALQVPASFEDSAAAALSSVGLSTSSARFDPAMLTLYRQGEFTTPLYDSIVADPWRTPFTMSMLRGSLAKDLGKPSDSLIDLARFAGYGPRRTLLGNPIDARVADAKKPGALLAVLTAMKRSGTIKGAIPSLESVPAEVQQAAALILGVDLDVKTFRDLAFQGVNIPEAFQMLSGPSPAESEALAFRKLMDFSHRVDLGTLAAGAHDLTLAAQTAADWVAAVKSDKKYDISITTDWGTISLSGGGDSTHNGPSLLVIDTGGNDTYLNAPSTSSASNWSSVCVDTAGADKYLSDLALAITPLEKWGNRKSGGNKPGPGGAIMGYCVLIDLAGNDLYRTHQSGLGSARYGFSALLDKAGDDVYDAYQNSEGYGEFGVGLLQDLDGNDRYDVFTQGQGMAFVMGVGALIDGKGDDRYTANDTTIDFPSPQSDKHNVSMAQGAGYGYRRDYTDNHSLAGGIGVLYDLGGKDTYSCAVFGQGVGYWEGVGILWDGGGDDSYLGQWYVQGAAAHYAVGYLEDLGGNDHYTALMNMADGAGHDFSIGYLLDQAGNDVYKSPNLSLGAGNDNGMGVFCDFAGDDTYETSGTTLGKANAGAAGTMRERAFSLGLFLDLGGTDQYPAALTWAGNGKRSENWTVKNLRPTESQFGIFWDR